MKAQVGAWLFAASIAFVGCGPEGGGAQATSTGSGSAIGAPCEGDGCGDCRPVMIRTVTGKTVEVCGNDDVSDHGDQGPSDPTDRNDGQGGHEQGPVGSDSAHDATDGGIAQQHAEDEADAALPADHADAAHDDDAGAAEDASGHAVDAGATDATTDATTDAANDAAGDDAACGTHP